MKLHWNFQQYGLRKLATVREPMVDDGAQLTVIVSVSKCDSLQNGCKRGGEER